MTFLVVLSIWVLILGGFIGAGLMKLHYQYGFKNIFDIGGDDDARTNGTNPRK